MASTISSFDDGGESATGSKTTTTARKILESVYREPEQENSTVRWRSVTEQRTYSSKLAEALRTSSYSRALASSSTSSDPASNSYIRTRAVRETADRVLAAAAKGRTRWSRAILTTRMRLGRMNHRKAKAKSTPSPAKSRQKKSESGGGLRRRNRLPVLQRRVRDLGRLIPGCRGLPLPNLLDETTDYIAALEMQVRAMAALAELLAGAGGEGANQIGRS